MTTTLLGSPDQCIRSSHSPCYQVMAQDLNSQSRALRYDDNSRNESVVVRKSRSALWSVFLIGSLMVFAISPVFPQDKKPDDKDIPKEQIPVQERKVGDGLVENLGELPGKIVTLPPKLFFDGVSLLAGLVDFNQVVLRVTDWLTNEDGTRKVRPIFTPYSGGGLAFVQKNLFTEGLDFRTSGSYGIRSRLVVKGRLQDRRLFSSKVGLGAAGFYHRLPDEDFFGIGNNSRRQDETNYLHQETNFALEVLSSPAVKPIFAVGFSYSDVNIEDGRDPRTPSIFAPERGFTPENVPGLLGAKLASLQFKIYHDTRKQTGHPKSGGEEFFSYEYARQIEGSELGYSKFTVDLQRYINLFYGRVLALRARTEITDNIGRKEIPFYRLAALGGADLLRGYRPVRFRDKDLLYFSAEYRFPIHLHAVAVAFLQEGRVFPDIFDDFTLNGFKYSAGGGLRLLSSDGGLTAAFEIAKSAEQLRFNFSLNSALMGF